MHGQFQINCSDLKLSFDNHERLEKINWHSCLLVKFIISISWMESECKTILYALVNGSIIVKISNNCFIEITLLILLVNQSFSNISLACPGILFADIKFSWCKPFYGRWKWSQFCRFFTIKLLVMNVIYRSLFWKHYLYWVFLFSLLTQNIASG